MIQAMYRMFMFLLISMGIICLWAPFHFYKVESADREIAAIRRIGVIDADLNPRRVSETEMEKFPEIRKALTELIFESNGDIPMSDDPALIRAAVLQSVTQSVRMPRLLNFKADAAMAFVKAFGSPSPKAFSIIYHNHLFQIEFRDYKLRQAILDNSRGGSGYAASLPVMFHLTSPIALFPRGSGMAMTPAAAGQWPNITEAMNALVADRSSNTDEKPLIPYEEWAALLVAIGANETDPAVVEYQGNLFFGEQTTDYHDIKMDSPITANMMRGFGALCLILGAFAARGASRGRERPGIPVATEGMVHVLDAVVIIFFAVFWFPVIDMAMARIWDAEAILGEEPITFIFGFCLVVGAPILAAYITSLSAQRIFVNAKGVKVFSAFSEKHIPWDKLAGVRTADYYVPVWRVGIPGLRRVAKTLSLQGPDVSCTILEPQNGAIKEQIINALREHAPQKWIQRIEKAGQEWKA